MPGIKVNCMKRFLIIFLSLFLISGCASSKYTRNLKKKSKDCDCVKQHKQKKQKAYKSRN